jgi:putative heme-binding domain-containing protein
VWELRPNTALPDVIAALNNPSGSMAERTAALDVLGNMEWPEAARAIEALLTAPSTPPALADRAFALYSHQLAGLWADAKTSPALPGVLRKGFASQGQQTAAVAIADGLSDPQYLPDLASVAKSSTSPVEARTAAIEAIAAVKDVRFVKDLQTIAESGPASVRVSAVRAIGPLNQPDVEPWARTLVLSDAPNEVRVEALKLLARTPAGLTAILDLAEKGSLAPELRTLAANLTNYAVPPPAPGRRNAPLSPVAIRVGRGAAPTDPAYLAIRERAAKVLPLPAARPVPSALELDFSCVGKPADGRKVFQADAGCAACHSLGGKKLMGPDLSAIGAKYGKQALLDHILNPSDAIGPEYVSTVFKLKNGDSVQGLVSEEAADRVVVITGVDQSVRLKPSDIASRQQIRVSLMPEGLLNSLQPQQIADLLEFLTTLR